MRRDTGAGRPTGPRPGAWRRPDAPPAPARWRRRRTLRLLLAGTLLLAALVAHRWEPAAPTTGIVVAARDLPGGHVLAADDLGTAALPTDAAPDGSVPAADAVVGTRLSARVRRGEPITDARVTGPPGAPDADGERRVVPVPLADPAVAEHLAPGDLVDLVAPADPDAQASSPPEPGPAPLPGGRAEPPRAPAPAPAPAPSPAETVATAAEVVRVPAHGRGGSGTILVAVPHRDAARLAATAAALPLAVLVHG